MKLFWLIGQLGIVLEVIGAGYIVYAAFKSRKELEGIEPETFGGMGEMSVRMFKLINKQFKNEAVGFSLLGIGLVMQFIGGFS